MDGKHSMLGGRLALATAAVLALTGIMGAGHAESLSVLPEDLTPASQTDSAASRFAPSENTHFGAQFQSFASDFAAPELEPEPATEHLGTGVASFYGKRFAGRPTASGESFDPQLLTAAHRTLPFGSRLRVTNPKNGKSVVVRINDRGPFSKGRHLDLSRSAAEQIGIVNAGHGSVEMELLLGQAPDL